MWQFLVQKLRLFDPENLRLAVSIEAQRWEWALELVRCEAQRVEARTIEFVGWKLAYSGYFGHGCCWNGPDF